MTSFFLFFACGFFGVGCVHHYPIASVLALVLTFLATGSAGAQTTYFHPVPVTLQNGTLAKSSDVDANFAQLVSDGNAANATLQAQIAALPPGTSLPHGAMVMIQASNCPQGFKVADGSGGAPDARGVLIRGLDNGAGRDPSRTLASYQGDTVRDHSHSGPNFLNAYTTVGTAGGSTGAISTGNRGPVTVSANTDGNPMAETRVNAVVLLHCYFP